jgi:hypothetical protein
MKKSTLTIIKGSVIAVMIMAVIISLANLAYHPDAELTDVIKLFFSPVPKMFSWHFYVGLAIVLSVFFSFCFTEEDFEVN